jgi:hypothetical protein
MQPYLIEDLSTDFSHEGLSTEDFTEPRNEKN